MSNTTRFDQIATDLLARIDAVAAYALLEAARDTANMSEAEAADDAAHAAWMELPAKDDGGEVQIRIAVELSDDEPEYDGDPSVGSIHSATVEGVKIDIPDDLEPFEVINYISDELAARGASFYPDGPFNCPAEKIPYGDIYEADFTREVTRAAGVS